MAEKASSIIGHRRSKAGTNLSHSEEAPKVQPTVSGSSADIHPLSSPAPSPAPGAYPSPSRQAAPKPGYNKGEKSFLAKLFSLSGRMGRLPYFVLAVLFDLYFFSIASFPEDTDNKVYGLWVLLLPLFVWIRIAGNTRRCHDYGRSGWLQLLPFYTFWMLLTPGDDFANKYDN
ncbi:MAG: DUF805 domain-containing protein [Bacteroidales bacterium]|nr:DUF805 domain-containing protein [Bacteroidales bacterium]